jgi:hypothetical protein
VRLELRYAKNQEAEGGAGDQRSLSPHARKELEGSQKKDIGIPETKGRKANKLNHGIQNLVLER